MDHQNYYYGCPCDQPQTHVHEVTGTVFLAGSYGKLHDHHFMGVTDEVVPVPGGHIHVFRTKTDYAEDHYHNIYLRTGRGIPVGDGKDARHVHYVDSVTQEEDRHLHKMLCATLIENSHTAK